MNTQGINVSLSFANREKLSAKPKIQNNRHKIALCGLLFFVSFYVNAQVFQVDTIIYNGDSGNRINFVFLGDGYKENELDNYIRNVRQLTANLFTQEPFKQYANYFNVFAIRVPSKVSGAALDPTKPVDNYFGSTFNYAGIDRLLVPQNQANITSVLAANFPAYDQVCMIVNSDKYGGSGGFPATASIEASSAEIMIHEIGHSFSGLRDEYWAGDQYAFEGPNMTMIASKGGVKWKNWLDFQGVGVYYYEEAPSWFRPHQNCKMRFLGAPFCAVCREAIIETFFEKSSPIDTYSPATANNSEADQTFTLQLVSPVPNTLKILWKLNGTQLDINADQFTSTNLTGDNQLLVKVVDATPLYRKTTVYEHFVKWDITNSSIKSKDSISINKTQEPEVITEIEKIDELKFPVSVYPNPATELVTLATTGIDSQPLKVSVFDDQGRRLEVPSHQTADGFQMIDFSRQPSGAYIIVMQSASGNFRTKIIKR